MGLLEKMYDDFKGLIKGAIFAIIFGYLFYVVIIAIGLQAFWVTGHHFWAVVLAVDVVVGSMSLGVALRPLFGRRSSGCGPIVLTLVCFVASILLCALAASFDK